jgi:aspartate/tyrosine/aromatic aminotransferase
VEQSQESHHARRSHSRRVSLPRHCAQCARSRKACSPISRRRPPGSIVILHACAHNPTGIDATEAQWHEIARVIQAKRHLPLFDVAYQGYVSGDPKRDGVALRLFAALGIDMVVCQSFSKNLGLYSERIGAAHFIVADAADAPKRLAAISSVLERTARGTYSNPPSHGAHIVSRIVLSDELRALWYGELKVMAERIELMRTRLREELEKLQGRRAGAHLEPHHRPARHVRLHRSRRPRRSSSSSTSAPST